MKKHHCYTTASRIYQCECCGEPIQKGEAMIIVTQEGFYKQGHQPSLVIAEVELKPEGSPK